MPFETIPKDGAADIEVMSLLVLSSAGQSVGQYMIWTSDAASQHLPEQVGLPSLCCKSVADPLAY